MGLCEGADGQHCTFLASTSRKQLPHILQKLRYRGASAEVGVWRGDYSSMILSGWRSGGKHYLVDPYLAYGDGCPHGGRNLTQAKRKYQSGGQWHCRFEQSAFDAVYNRTSARIAAQAGSRAVFMRQFSAQAAAALGSSGEQLDAVYLDGRHDYAGTYGRGSRCSAREACWRATTTSPGKGPRCVPPSPTPSPTPTRPPPSPWPPRP